MAWNHSYKAPKGRFRVIGEDTFPWPHEEYLIGDFPTFKAAEAAAKKAEKPMNPTEIYDDTGDPV